MKNKLLLPVMAVVMAALSAFASMPAQQAWFDANGAIEHGATQGTITIPSDRNCTLSGQQVCKITVNSVQYNAFDTPEHAEANGGMESAGLLKYN